MDRSVLAWLLEEENPEVRLRTLKEYKKLPEDDERVVECRKLLLHSKVYLNYQGKRFTRRTHP